VSQLEGPGLHPDQERERQRAQTEGAPKAVKLEPALDEMGKPEDRPPVPPAAAVPPAQRVPRVIHQNERSPDPARWRRVKVRCDEPFGSQPTRYILVDAEGAAEKAKAYYLESTGLKAVIDSMPRTDLDGKPVPVPRPRMVVNVLPD
jgi:hypothetical protein